MWLKLWLQIIPINSDYKLWEGRLWSIKSSDTILNNWLIFKVAKKIVFASATYIMKMQQIKIR